MKKPARALAAVALLALAAGAAAGSAVAGKKLAPALRVASLRPLTVQGLNFAGGERVTVTLLVGGRSTIQRATATGGRIVVKFPAASVTKCTAFTVRAVGAKGPVALLRAKAAADCSVAKPPAAGGTSAKAAATVVFGSTVIVKGTGFKPGEAVTISLAGDQTWTRHATASAAGTFSADFGALTINECSAYTLTATGAKGSSYTFDHALVPC